MVTKGLMLKLFEHHVLVCMKNYNCHGFRDNICRESLLRLASWHPESHLNLRLKYLISSQQKTEKQIIQL